MDTCMFLMFSKIHWIPPYPTQVIIKPIKVYVRTCQELQQKLGIFSDRTIWRGLGWWNQQLDLPKKPGRPLVVDLPGTAGLWRRPNLDGSCELIHLSIDRSIDLVKSSPMNLLINVSMYAILFNSTLFYSIYPILSYPTVPYQCYHCYWVVVG